MKVLLRGDGNQYLHRSDPYRAPRSGSRWARISRPRPTRMHRPRPAPTPGHQPRRRRVALPSQLAPPHEPNATCHPKVVTANALRAVTTAFSHLRQLTLTLKKLISQNARPDPFGSRTKGCMNDGIELSILQRLRDCAMQWCSK
jgi:hypothetical protein